MQLLRAGVPLTLLYDVFYAGMPKSSEIYEREPGDVSWVKLAAA